MLMRLQKRCVSCVISLKFLHLFCINKDSEIWCWYVFLYQQEFGLSVYLKMWLWIILRSCPFFNMNYSAYRVIMFSFWFVLCSGKNWASHDSKHHKWIWNFANDAVGKVLGKEHSGQVRCLGLGVVPSRAFKQNRPRYSDLNDSSYNNGSCSSQCQEK